MNRMRRWPAVKWRSMVRNCLWDAIDATLRDIRGTLFFANHAVAADAIQARLHGRSVQVGLDTDEGMQRLSARTEVDIGDPQGLARFLPVWFAALLGGRCCHWICV